jgi:TetR/AcrR family transcriptional regulator, cholesterol catabolism regulator
VPDSRRARKKDRTRSEIFRAALDLFGARGFDAVTVEQICASADVARGTFFLHFPSKAALLVEWNRELAAELAERLRDPRDSALAQYRTLVEELGEQWRRRPDATRALLHALLAPRAAGEPAERDLRALVEVVVQRGQERGEFRRNVSARLAAAAFLATCAAAFAAAEPDGSPAAQRNELLHALLHGLSEPRPRLKWAPAP